MPPISARAALRVNSGLLGGGDAVEQNAKGILSHILILAMLAQGCGQIKHHQKVMQPAQGKFYVTATAQLQPPQWRLARGRGLLHDSGEPLEPLRSDRHPIIGAAITAAAVALHSLESALRCTSRRDRGPRWQNE